MQPHQGYVCVVGMELLQSVAKVLGTLNGITFYDGVLSF